MANFVGLYGPYLGELLRAYANSRPDDLEARIFALGPDPDYKPDTPSPLLFDSWELTQRYATVKRPVVLPPPPEEWEYPRLTITAIPSAIAGPFIEWDGVPQPIPVLEGFYWLWRALQKSIKAKDDLIHFKDKVLELTPRLGLLEPHPLSDRFSMPWKGLVVRGGIQDSLMGWVKATVTVRFWWEVLSSGVGEPVWGFLESLRGFLPPAAGDWGVYLKLLADPSTSVVVDSFWPLYAVIELLHLHEGMDSKGYRRFQAPRETISERLVREYLRLEGLRGLIVPGPTHLAPRLGTQPNELPNLVGYMGSYHRALFELSRYKGHRATCAHCHKAFIRERKTGKYCSGACRVAASRERQRGSR
ncbi:hypothetical protein Mrose_00680 [Calidithermus roseus]|uniref:Uncharacterized protein n=1 Tax=Calidithermus roseus TaxID=1644118 RepID=A0A399EW35_9DEIN|nr:hypothetical protein Mrose_00680 [Calidithermus roseus]